MGSDTQDRAAVRIPPPLIFVAAAIAGWLLHDRVLALPLVIPAPFLIPVVLALMLPGVALVLGPMALFRRTGQDPAPWKATPEIVSSGIFRFTRNPMYVGMALVQAAYGVGRGNGWTVALVPAAILGVYFTAVRHEEAYLERKFGRRYLDYKSSVRRWL